MGNPNQAPLSAVEQHSAVPEAIDGNGQFQAEFLDHYGIDEELAQQHIEYGGHRGPLYQAIGHAACPVGDTLRNAVIKAQEQHPGSVEETRAAVLKKLNGMADFLDDEDLAVLVNRKQSENDQKKN